ncbi:hypothetical protein HanRHA438_Chr07g0313611 [Helianthus annuus]|uniref:Uncharacterized protein n=1 Tax=Helianthus annuus TaxID=4232 RepID=A0A251UBK2_HELAN|nr:hypothetical protein HanXRQr2_Chr07g0303731 [Helianthus annuus]KAJ0550814.1 hypothetical protein HanHA300_Chr07g0250161 [Helianthus annuus]KAJ0563782.1 hypothetical protein HanHA89_Chr07g0266991 [Helianthus annuus]KAJ0729118.1 hypothetical protein HanLR1_Chr07g0249381 [Helianthus annuus]KAJ0731858.1 hypothetical protein HanOQP8_Chr07g0256731 [Helianthus annuus]
MSRGGGGVSQRGFGSTWQRRQRSLGFRRPFWLERRQRCEFRRRPTLRRRSDEVQHQQHPL